MKDVSPIEFCCKNAGGSSKPDFSPSEENGRRLWREGDPEHCGVYSCGLGCIQVSSEACFLQQLWEEDKVTFARKAFWISPHWKQFPLL